MPQRRHRGRAVGRHGALAVAGVVRPAGRLGRFPVAPQVEEDEAVGAGQVRGEAVPDQEVLREAVEEEEGGVGGGGGGGGGEGVEGDGGGDGDGVGG